jgi:hypothetical protein
MICYRCKHEFESTYKIAFHAICPKCETDLHVCKNCRFYCPGKPNDCLVPGTEFIRDRERANFEEFSLLPPPKPHSLEDPLQKAKRIFGEDLPKKHNPFQEES